MKPYVSVIVLNYNGKQFVDDCLSSLLKQTYSHYEVVFVDNQSTDGSLQYAKKKFPHIRVIQNGGNFGYAKGNNEGIRKTEGKYVLIINPDTKVKPTFLEELVKGIESDPSVAAVQPKILNFSDPSLIDTISPRIHYTGLAWGDIYKKDRGKYAVQELSFGSGTAILVKREVLNAIGSFDEDFFMYHEDVDLGWRMNMTGHKILLIPTAVMYHKYSFSRSKTKNFFLERNRLLFILKNFERKTIFLLFPILLLTEISVLLFSMKDGWSSDKLRGYRYM